MSHDAEKNHQVVEREINGVSYVFIEAPTPPSPARKKTSSPSVKKRTNTLVDQNVVIKLKLLDMFSSMGESQTAEFLKFVEDQVGEAVFENVDNFNKQREIIYKICDLLSGEQLNAIYSCASGLVSADILDEIAQDRTSQKFNRNHS